MSDSVTDDEYQKGLEALSNLISGRVRQDGKNWSHAFDMMQVYLERLNLESELPKLSVIHVAGTKGKGSTCAMIENILRQAGYKTGLYTSPHLIDVRERIRINGEPVDKDTFLRNVWSTLQMLEEKASDDSGKPAYFRFLTLLGFRIFLEANVDVAILEVGLGGRLDATNCIREPVVCGVAALGFDHMDLLGHTLPEIAREKAGIFKPNKPAYSVTQREDAAEALQQVADRIGAPLAVVEPFDNYKYRPIPDSASLAPAKDIQLGLAGEHQRQNAALAVRLAAEWEARSEKAKAQKGSKATTRAQSVVEDKILPPEYVAGLQAARWPGRGQTVCDTASILEGTANSDDSRLTFYLDGAHTSESMVTCAHWFADATWTVTNNETTTKRLLLFNCMQERDPTALLQPLRSTLAARNALPSHALFVPTESTYMKLGKSDDAPDLSWQLNLRRVWKEMGGSNPVPTNGTSLPKLPALPGSTAAIQEVTACAVIPNLQATLEWLRRCVRETPSVKMQVLVTGSLYLVGDLLRLLGKTTNSSSASGNK